MVEAGKTRKEASPEQVWSHQSRIGVIAEVSKKDNTRSKNQSKGKRKVLKPKIQGNWKVAGNPRVMPSTPSISTCHMATLRTAPPSCIKFGAEPQASQTTQKKPFTFCGPHDTSLTTLELGGQLMGVTRMHYLDEANTNDEVILSNEEISHHWHGKESHSMMPASSLGSYETSKTDRWEPNKSPIIGLEALLREALTFQRLATKITYIKPLHWQHKVHILIF